MPAQKPHFTLKRGDDEVIVPLVLRETLLGRIDSNHVVLDDPSVSRVHARVLLEGDHFEIEDCGSSTGTLVNGEAIDRSRLRNGDIVKVGAVFLLYSE